MSHRTTVWPPQTGRIGAAGSRTRGLLPPVYPPPGHQGQPSAASSPSCPRIPPGVRVLTALSISPDHRYPSHPRTNVLPKRRRLP
jgi:hypothetical protein